MDAGLTDRLLQEARTDIKLLNNALNKLNENVILLSSKMDQVSSADFDHRLEHLERRVAEDRNMRKGAWWLFGGLTSIIGLAVTAVEALLHVR